MNEPELVLKIMNYMSSNTVSIPENKEILETIEKYIDNSEMLNSIGKDEFTNLKHNKDWDLFIEFWKKYKDISS